MSRLYFQTHLSSLLNIKELECSFRKIYKTSDGVIISFPNSGPQIIIWGKIAREARYMHMYVYVYVIYMCIY